LAVVHFVDVIPREDQDMAGSIAFKEIEILPNGIGRAPVPVEAYALLGRHDFKEVSYLPAEDIPAFFQMIVQRLGLILGKNDESIKLRVHTVAQGKIHQSIDPAKWDGRFGPVPRERHEPLSFASSHDKGEYVSHRFTRERKTTIVQ